MICPLRIDYTQITGDHNDVIDYRYQSCVTTNCAWWDTTKNQCAIMTLAQLKINGVVNTKEAK